MTLTTSMTKPKTIVLLVLLSIMTIGLLYYFDAFKTKMTIQINDGSPKTVRLAKNTSGKYVHGIYVKLKGQVNGTIVVNSTYCTDRRFYQDTISGDFNKTWCGDWYGDTCCLVFMPITGNKGVIDITYQFYASGQ